MQLLLTNHGFHINQNSFENNYNFKNDKGEYNLLAELLSDKNNIPLIFVKFKGKDKSSISERTDYGRCSLVTAYYNMKNRLLAENICMTNTRVRPRKDIYLYNMDSVNEALINALVHNDWNITEPLISFFEDRLEIISHGGLPFKQTKEQFFRGISIPRNTALMRVFQDLEIAEHTGHGVPTIIDYYGEKVFDINNNYINVVIPFNQEVINNHKSDINGNLNGNISGTLNDTLNNNEQNILKQLLLNPRTTIDEASILLNIPKRTISRYFKTLQEKGYIERIGSKKTGLWKIKK